MPQNNFFYELAIFWSAKKRRKDTFFFSILHPLSTVIFATATVLAFVLLPDSRFNFQCYTQRKATPTQKSARKCAATSRDFLRERLQSAFTLANQLRRIAHSEVDRRKPYRANYNVQFDLCAAANGLEMRASKVTIAKLISTGKG